MTARAAILVLAGAFLLVGCGLAMLWRGQRRIETELAALRDGTGVELITPDHGSDSWQPIHPVDDRTEFTIGGIVLHVDSIRHSADSSRMWGVIVNPSVLVVGSIVDFQTDTAASCYDRLGTVEWRKCLAAVGRARVEMASLPPGRGFPFAIALRSNENPKRVRWHMTAYTYPVGVPRG